MSKTPRTDQAAFTEGLVVVDADFARELETELAEARAEAERKNKLIEQMREAFERINSAAWRIKLAQGNAACSCESLNAADIIAWSSEHRRAALSAAERGE